MLADTCSDVRMFFFAFNHLPSDYNARCWAGAQVGQTVKQGTYTILKFLGQGGHAVCSCSTNELFVFFLACVRVPIVTAEARAMPKRHSLAL
eukprot:1192885-Prorocentrum_minimum.AAC.2